MISVLIYVKPVLSLDSLPPICPKIYIASLVVLIAIYSLLICYLSGLFPVVEFNVFNSDWTEELVTRAEIYVLLVSGAPVRGHHSGSCDPHI